VIICCFLIFSLVALKCKKKKKKKSSAADLPNVSENTGAEILHNLNNVKNNELAQKLWDFYVINFWLFLRPLYPQII
jgi:hypothetical protein